MDSIQSLQPPTVSPEQQLQPDQAEKNPWLSRKNIIIGGAILIITGVIFVSEMRSSTHTNTPSSLQKPTPVSSTLKSQNAGVKPDYYKYRNDATKFAFSYPSNLQKTEKAYGLGITSIEFNNTTGTPVYKMLTIPKAMAKLINQDFDTLYNQQDNTETIIKDPTSDQKKRFVKIKNRTVGSQRAFDFLSTASPQDPNEVPEEGTYVELGDNILLISTTQANKTTLDSLLQSFEYPLQPY